jgi:IS30 family transposase
LGFVVGKRLLRSVEREVLLLRRGGVTLVDVAGRCSVAVSTVASVERKNAGVCASREFRVRSSSLSEGERLQVYDGIRDGCTDAEIGRLLGRHRGTIGREIDRNGGRRVYRPYLAERRAEDQASRSRDRWFVTRPELWGVVLGKVALLWSPEQIMLWLKVEYPDQPEWWVSHESIYQALYVQSKGELNDQVKTALRTGRVQRRSRTRTQRNKTCSSSIPNLVSISQRPASVEDRAVPGHWEGDLIVGAYNRSAVATVLERTSRYVMLVKVESKQATHVGEQLSAHMATLPDQLRRSLTWDRGSEIAEHEKFTIETNIPVYICDPKSPWQRGSNENINGLIRQYLPKGTDLSIPTQDDLDTIANSLNTRPRKVLGVKTPAQVLADLVAATT